MIPLPQLNTNKNHTAIVIAMFAVAVLIITFAMPQKSINDLPFEVGRAWTHPQLNAQIDVPIEYDTLTARQIRDSINASFIKIYRHDYSLEQQQIKQLNAQLSAQPNVPEAVRQQILIAVSHVYNQGVVDNNTHTLMKSGKLSHVRMLSNNVANVIDTKNFLSAGQAYKQIKDTLPQGIAQEAIMQASLYKYLVPNILFDSIESNKLLEDTYKTALAPRGVIQVGERIISPGTIVTPQLAHNIRLHQQLLRQNSKDSNETAMGLLGTFLVVAALMSTFFLFMRVMRPRTFGNLRLMVFLISLITLFLVVVFVFISIKAGYVYIVPFALLPIIITTFTDSRIGFFANMVAMLIAMLAVIAPMEFMLLQFMAGMLAITTMQTLLHRSQLLRCAALIFAGYIVIYCAFLLIRSGSLTAFNWHVLLMLGINCVVLSFAYFGIFLVEKIFGFTSSVTLVELADINTPLLRRLSEDCPGTFQHSMQVGNLATAIAHRIGGDVQLLRAGALYHDIGKIENPAFFTENQQGVNPHDSLTPEQSARIVIAHVTDGLKLAAKHNLPQAIADLIPQHHGRGMTKYFYTMACKQHDPETVDPEIYTYPGPNPQTKEAAILMMCDACEAASKSLDLPNEENITRLVNNIIDSQLHDGLLSEAPVSLRDIRLAKQVLIERLLTFYHARVKYPDQIQPQPKQS